MSIERFDHPFPIVMGTEEETGMLVSFNGRDFDEPYDLAGRLRQFIPEELRGRHHKMTPEMQFLTDGFKLYPEGSNEDIRPTNIEICTPEGISPDDVTTSIRAGELIMRLIAGNYVTRESYIRSSTAGVRMQRRVVDSRGNRKACHDNFGYPAGGIISGSLRSDHKSYSGYIDPVFRSFLGTRFALTGALHVDQNRGLFYSQKINGLKHVIGYGYAGTMIRADRTEPGITRIETRSNDINISDWAAKVRIGGVALILALIEVNEAQELYKYSNDSGDADFIEDLKHVNELFIDYDGNLVVTRDQRKAITFQAKIAELALTRLGLHTDIPNQYFKIAQEIFDFCSDYLKVADGDADFEILADRADWAAKLSVVRSRLNRDREFGISRRYDDLSSVIADLKYDYYGIEADNGLVVAEREGYGYKLRKKNKFKATTSSEKVEYSVHNPPENTRAKLRSELLKRFDSDWCDWSKLFFSNPDYYIDDDEELEFIPVILYPRQTKLDSDLILFLNDRAERISEPY